MPEPQSVDVRHYVHDVVFDLGYISDPITGRPCRGTRFADSQKFFQELTQKHISNTAEN